jgi:hypothetical protein
MAVLLAAATLAPGALAAPLDAGWFRDGTATATLIDNAAFLPSAGAQAAAEAFEGVLVLGETTMLTEPAVFKSSDVLGANPQVFPGVTLGFATDGGYLVPAEQGVIRYGSIHAGKSFWDVIVQPGTVWSEPGDDGWSRASFPLALVHSIEGETHNGVGMFLYRGEEVSDLRVQITQQTSPFYVEDYFLASARVPMRREAGQSQGGMRWSWPSGSSRPTRCRSCPGRSSPPPTPTRRSTPSTARSRTRTTCSGASPSTASST